MKIDSKKLITTFIILVILGITVYSCVSAPLLKDIVITVISFVAALAVFIQIKEGTEVSRAEFIINLQETYSEAEGFTDLFTHCWQNYNNNLSYKEMSEYLKRDGKDEVLLNYLTFFESIYLMKEQGVLRFDILDELFGRRFFIVVNNKAVQDIDLVPNYKYYLNVIYLYNDWKGFRLKSIKKSKNKEKIKEDLFIEFSEIHRNNYIDLSERIAGF